MPIVEKAEGDISSKTIQEGDSTIETADKIFSFVEQNPDFPGGQNALMDFINSNLKYPEAEKLKRVSGFVMVRFVVDENGKLIAPVISKGINPNLDAEALRVVNMLPNFNPGKQNGKPVKVYFNMPIRFKLP